MSKKDAKIGIVGGAGPYAGLDLAQKSTPRGYFCTKNSGIDAESAIESENITQDY